MICADCSTEFAADALSCPGCRRLTHSAELEDLARRAQAAWRVGKFADERALWAESLALLPEDTVQHQRIAARIAEIDGQRAASTGTGESWWRGKAGMGIGPLLLLLLTKGKFLLLGLTKMGTLLTMLASLGVYWAIYGWAFALGLVISIYIHEMGHVAAIRGYGFPAGAPMFIPGFGAFIQMRGVALPPIPDSRIGLAGPLYGLGAALASLGLFYATGRPIWAVIAHFGAMINMFNLIPIWQLDGSRGLRSLTRTQRGMVLAAAGGLWAVLGIPMLGLVALGCAYRMFTKDWEDEPDQQGLMQFLGIMVALALVFVLSAGGAAVTQG
ncbi:MAG: peptidase [Candidatus Solibacter sp.]|jgi:Zn-dependent protease|nr:peptidase [Candidatus Solibacter sp.]